MLGLLGRQAIRCCCAGLVAGSQASPPQLGGSQVTLRVRMTGSQSSRHRPVVCQAPVRQTPSTAGFVPVAERLAEQSPVLQPAAQDRVCVKDCPSQTVVGAGDHAASPQVTQSCVLQDRLCVRTGDPGHAPPHASGLLLLLVLLLLCVPPSQDALQALQALHGDQDPHRQLLGGFLPGTVRLVSQSSVLQPSLQVLVWMTDCPTQTSLGSTAGAHGSLPHTTGQSCVLQAWLCVSVSDPLQAPPHNFSTVLFLVLVLLCMPPSQSAVQVSQALHCDQGPH